MISPPRIDWTAEKVGQLRYQMGMTQAKFAEALGVSKAAVQEWEYKHDPIKGTAARLLDYVADSVGFRV